MINISKEIKEWVVYGTLIGGIASLSYLIFEFIKMLTFAELSCFK